MRDSVVLFSGGPDSFITYKYLQSVVGERHNIVALYENLDHRYVHEELRALDDCEKLLGISILRNTVLKGLGITEDPDAYIHHRNAYLCLAASALLPKDGTIYLTVQKDELSIPDRTPEFMQKMGSLLSSLSGRSIHVFSPWLEKDKTDMVTWFLDNGGDPEELKQTWSCYTPINGVQCGNCPACFRRWVAFTLNGISEIYMRNPAYSLVASVYEEKALSNLYSTDRCNRIQSALAIGRTL